MTGALRMTTPKNPQKAIMTTNLPVATEIIPMVLQLQPAMSRTGVAAALTEDQFYEFCQLNRDFCIERNTVGELVIMPPTASFRN